MNYRKARQKSHLRLSPKFSDIETRNGPWNKFPFAFGYFMSRQLRWLNSVWERSRSHLYQWFIVQLNMVQCNHSAVPTNGNSSIVKLIAIPKKEASKLRMNCSNTVEHVKCENVAKNEKWKRIKRKTSVHGGSIFNDMLGCYFCIHFPHSIPNFRSFKLKFFSSHFTFVQTMVC